MAEDLTAETITDAQIEALKREAGCAGDFLGIQLCRLALDGDVLSRGHCADSINAARREAKG